MNRVGVLITVVAMGTVMVCPRLLAGSLPKACHASDTIDEADQGAVTRERKFVRPNGKEYPFQTFSLWANDPRVKDTLCFRYEVQNKGNEDIEEFRWPDIGLHKDRVIPPNEPRFKKQHEKHSLSRHARDSDTDVKAFENSSDTTRAWFTVEDIGSQAIQTSETKDLVPFAVEESMPSIVPTLRKAALSTAQILGFRRPAVKSNFGPLHTRVSIGKFQFVATTEATFDGVLFHATTVISSVGMEKVFAPALSAINEFYKEPLDESDVSNVAEAMRKFVAAPLPQMQDEVRITHSFHVPTAAELPAMYVMEHPVTVVTAGRALCVEVSSYSPIPMKVGSEYCNEDVF